MKKNSTPNKHRPFTIWTCLAIALLALQDNARAQEPYWQQTVDNDIQVELDDQEHLLRGAITMRYKNQSPDTLSFIYLHLYPNAYRTDRTAFEKQAVENGDTRHYFSNEAERGYIDSLRFEANYAGEAITCELLPTENIDIAKLLLPRPLAPGQEATLSSPFKVKIPLNFSRLGHEGQSYQISQWFPKPAVYDAQGWHPMPYLDQGEFYSEFGTYTVRITLPRNYIVMATGEVQESEERNWLASLAARPPEELPQNGAPAPPSDPELKTLTFVQDRVHDFAWFADKQWAIEIDTILLENKEPITAYIAYLPWNKKNWEQGMKALKTAVHLYSEEIGPYPYSTIKAADGPLEAGGGMEYPTVTVISGQMGSETAVALVHEAGHNWFYGILANNERRWPWMDESINSFYEQKVMKRLGQRNSDRERWAYAIVSAFRGLLPLDAPADAYPATNYGIDIYYKGRLFFDWLEAYMGPDRFSRAMKEYYATWQFKHTSPQAWEQIFKKHSDKDISWFFDSALKSDKSVDFSIGRVEQQEGRTLVAVRNKTGFWGPAKVELWGQNEDTLSLWTPPFTGETLVSFDYSGPYKDVRIAPVVPDYNPKNDRSKREWGIGAFGSLNGMGKNKLWIAPAIGYNYYDGFMAGLLFHNITLPQNRLQMALVPLWGFGSGHLGGTGFLSYALYADKGWIKSMELSLEGKSFSYGKRAIEGGNLYSGYTKLAPEWTLNLRKPYWRSSINRSLSIKAYWIREERTDYAMDQDSIMRPFNDGFDDRFYARLRYRFRDDRTFNPYSYSLEAQAGRYFAKLSAEAQLRIDYDQSNKALYMRAFAGKMFGWGSANESYRYGFAQTYSGRNDYLYDGTFIGRYQSTGLWAQQIEMKEGGFKVNTLQYAMPVGTSDNWLMSLNLKSDLPLGKLPVRVFADLGFTPSQPLSASNSMQVAFDAGLEIYLFDWASVYVPLFMSGNYNDYVKSIFPKDRLLKTISFSINLGSIDWGTFLRSPSKP